MYGIRGSAGDSRSLVCFSSLVVIHQGRLTFETTQGLSLTPQAGELGCCHGDLSVVVDVCVFNCSKDVTRRL